jgi:hypothetical protein
MPTTVILLAGESYRLRYEYIDMSSVEQTLELMKLGTAKKSFFQLLDPPYDVREEAVLLLAGINGARRLASEDEIKMDEVQKILNSHFAYIGKQSDGDMSKFQTMHGELMSKISEAARAGMGFSRKAPKEEMKEKAESGPTKEP